MCSLVHSILLAGMHYNQRGPSNEICAQGGSPKLLDLELGFIGYGFHWDRQERRGFVVGMRTEGSWDRGYLHGAAGVFVVLDEAGKVLRSPKTAAGDETKR
jgi:hypothetical protein